MSKIVWKIKNKNPPTRPIILANQDENLNINFMEPYLKWWLLKLFYGNDSLSCTRSAYN